MSVNDSDSASCGACGLEVTDTGFLCDTCYQKYHPICENMGDDSYNFHNMNADFSWVCQTCGAPNHSVLSLGNNLASFESHNSFSSLSDSASRPSELSAEHTTVSHKNLRYATLKVLNINARSIKAQDNLDQFHAAHHQCLPDIVICTESWLTPNIYDAAIIPSSLGYTMFRRDRGSRGGGIFILVQNLYIANRLQEWETDCEILWIKLQLARSVPFTLLPINQVSQTQRVSKSLKGQLPWCQR